MCYTDPQEVGHANTQIQDNIFHDNSGPRRAQDRSFLYGDINGNIDPYTPTTGHTKKNGQHQVSISDVA